jgi:hypothetical protein
LSCICNYLCNALVVTDILTDFYWMLQPVTL